MKKITQEEIKKSVGKILSDAGVEHNDEEIYLIIGCCEQFKSSGYDFSYEKITEFLVSKKNLEMIKEEGLKNTILAMSNMRLGTIKKKPTLGRNEICNCGSGKKHKKCCMKL